MQTTQAPDGTLIVTAATPEEKQRIAKIAQGHTTPPNLGNIKQVAAVLGDCSTKTVQRLVDAGYIEQIRFSQRRIRYDLDAVAEFARTGIAKSEVAA